MTVLGLPLHPLVVHLAVVFVPLAAIAFVGVMWRAEWRRAYGSLVTSAAVVGAVGALLAAQSGEDMEDRLRRTTGQRLDFGSHPDQGDATQMLAIVFALVAVALWFIERRGVRGPSWLPTAAYGLGAVLAVSATVAITLTGHSGATLVWAELGTFVTPR